MPSQKIREIAEDAGWTDGTLLLVLLDAVDNACCEPADVVAYCARVARDESGGAEVPTSECDCIPCTKDALVQGGECNCENCVSERDEDWGY